MTAGIGFYRQNKKIEAPSPPYLVTSRSNNMRSQIISRGWRMAGLIMVAAVLLTTPAVAGQGFCQQDITLKSVERLAGQGIGEGVMEVTVEATLPSRGVSADTGRFKLRSGMVRNPNLHVGSVWVPLGTGAYDQTVETKVTEHEVASDKFVGDTDRGNATSKTYVKCGVMDELQQVITIQDRSTAGKVKITYAIGAGGKGTSTQSLQIGRNRVIANMVTREQGTDRPGMDYRNFELVDANPGLCAQQCAEENRCKAYTFVPPGVQGKNARCWLKGDVPGKQSQQGLVSGLKTSVRVPMESNLNLPGSDYKNFDLAAAEPARCASACATDPRCEAYTYVKPGVQGNNARCWLKDAVPNRVQGNCCVSGIKAAAN
jgi:hypothetical protein